jgi:hypothetical protein
MAVFPILTEVLTTEWRFSLANVSSWIDRILRISLQANRYLPIVFEASDRGTGQYGVTLTGL